MSDRITCSVHGETAPTYVCVHIIDSLRDGKPRGFSWSVDDEDEYQAVCRDCRNTTEEEWERIGSEVGRILCFGCYEKAAKLNGIEISKGGLLS